MNEQNLIELGIQTMHERKQVFRAIRQLRNDPQSTYGKFKVRMMNSHTQKHQEVSLKVSDNETKVKHILKQALSVFTQTKSELTQFCLAKLQPHVKSRSILSNETIFLSLLHEDPTQIDVFEICTGTEFVTTASIDTSGAFNSIQTDSPLQKGDKRSSSLDRILVSSSPPQDVNI